MDSTFIKIGQVIRGSISSRMKYHPMIAHRNIMNKNKKGEDKLKPNIASIYDINVDIDNNTITVSNDYIVHNNIPYVRFDFSSASGHIKYLVGTCVFKTTDILTQLSINTFNDFYLNECNFSHIITENSFIMKFRKTLDNNLSVIVNLIQQDILNDVGKKKKDIKKIALNMTVTYNGVTKVAHEFVECLDIMDDMFSERNYIKGKGYTFIGRFYNEFNYEKYISKGVRTKPKDSIPYYTKDDFISLYYARNIYNQTSFKITEDYSVSIFPEYDGLNMNEIEKLLFTGKDIFNFNNVCEEIELIKNSRIIIDQNERIKIPLLLKFNVHYRYKNGNAGNQNMLCINGIRYNQISRIKDHVNNEFYPDYYDKKAKIWKRKTLYYALSELYSDLNNDSKKYMTLILRTLQNIFQEVYTVPSTAEYCLISKTEHTIRTESKEFEKTWNKLFKTYKFLKTMENNDYIKELTTDMSFLLGADLAKYESRWRRDRENLQKTFDRFAGSISRNINTIEEVIVYYNNITERLKRNDAFIIRDVNIIDSAKKVKNFDKNRFITGYFDELSRYRGKIEETTEETIKTIE